MRNLTKIKIVFFVIITLPLALFSQNISDSIIEKFAKLKNDTNQLKAISAEIEKNDITDKLTIDLNELLGQKSKLLINDPNIKIRNCAKLYYANYINTKGYIAKVNGNLNEAIKLYLLALKEFTALNSKKDVAAIYINISGLYHSQNNKKLSVEYIKKAIKIAEENKFISLLSYCYNNLGVLHMQNPEKAISYLYQAIKWINTETGSVNIRQLGNTYSNIAGCF